MLMTKIKTATAVLLVALLAATLGTLIVWTPGATAADPEKETPSGQTEGTKAEELPPVQVRIASLVGMKVAVQGASGKFDKSSQVEVPGRLHLGQGKVSRLRLADIPNHPGSVRFPTVEIPMVEATTEPFVSVSTVPIEFIDADFEQVAAGNAITKVVYLVTGKAERKSPDRPGEVVTMASYSCDEDVLVEARRRGAILAVVRMGDIDLGVAGMDRVVQGRMLRADAAPGKGKDDLAQQLERLRAEFDKQTNTLAIALEENKVLKLQREKTEKVAKFLRDALEEKERELQKMKRAKDAGGR
jgi:hypothetical protein